MDPYLDRHFEKPNPETRDLYDVLLASVRKFGSVEEDPKKTSIHLNSKTAFAGVRVRRDHLLLTIKSDRDIHHARVAKSERTSANRWHVEVRVREKADIDKQLTAWLKTAYNLSA